MNAYNSVARTTNAIGKFDKRRCYFTVLTIRCCNIWKYSEKKKKNKREKENLYSDKSISFPEKLRLAAGRRHPARVLAMNSCKLVCVPAPRSLRLYYFGKCLLARAQLVCHCIALPPRQSIHNFNKKVKLSSLLTSIKKYIYIYI